MRLDPLLNHGWPSMAIRPSVFLRVGSGRESATLGSLVSPVVGALAAVGASLMSVIVVGGATIVGVVVSSEKMATEIPTHSATSIVR